MWVRIPSGPPNSPWCNGCVRDSGSRGEGSIPSGLTNGVWGSLVARLLWMQECRGFESHHPDRLWQLCLNNCPTGRGVMVA